MPPRKDFVDTAGIKDYFGHFWKFIGIFYLFVFGRKEGTCQTFFGSRFAQQGVALPNVSLFPERPLTISHTFISGNFLY